MANDKKKMVEAITAQEVDFAQWYTDICTKAELVEYSSVKGFVVLRPYGYAIWENIQKNLDSRFKATGHENVAMPVLIPESLLKKEGELVNGFAPEVAWVTAGGSDPLEERLAVRPTSETMFCDHFSHVLHSYRRPLGEIHPSVPAHPRVLVAGRPHHPRDRRGSQGRDRAAAELLRRLCRA